MTLDQLPLPRLEGSQADIDQATAIRAEWLKLEEKILLAGYDHDRDDFWNQITQTDAHMWCVLREFLIDHRRDYFDIFLSDRPCYKQTA